jgi:hypothetical protein
MEITQLIGCQVSAIMGLLGAGCGPGRGYWLEPVLCMEAPRSAHARSTRSLSVSCMLPGWMELHARGGDVRAGGEDGAHLIQVGRGGHVRYSTQSAPSATKGWRGQCACACCPGSGSWPGRRGSPPRYASGRSNSPLRVPVRNARHSEGVNESMEPLGLRE